MPDDLVPVDTAPRSQRGRELKTLSDAYDMVLGLPESRQREPYWQHAAELLRYAAENDKEAIDDMRAQFNRALHRDGLI